MSRTFCAALGFGIALPGKCRAVSYLNLAQHSKPVPGITVTLDRLVYFLDTDARASDAPHAFIYFLTIRNLSDRSITVLARAGSFAAPRAA